MAKRKLEVSSTMTLQARIQAFLYPKTDIEFEQQLGRVFKSHTSKSDYAHRGSAFMFKGALYTLPSRIVDWKQIARPIAQLHHEVHSEMNTYLNDLHKVDSEKRMIASYVQRVVITTVGSRMHKFFPPQLHHLLDESFACTELPDEMVTDFCAQNKTYTDLIKFRMTYEFLTLLE